MVDGCWGLTDFQFSNIQCRPVCFLIEVFLPCETFYFQNEIFTVYMGIGRRRKVRNEKFHDRARGSKWEGMNENK